MVETSGVFDRIAKRLYDRLGKQYAVLALLVSGPAAVFVSIGTVAVLASYYEPTMGEAAIVMAVAAVSRRAP